MKDERDQYRFGDLSGRVLFRGTRLVKNGGVRINGERYGNAKLSTFEGKRVELLVFDIYGLSYSARHGDTDIGIVRYLRRDGETA